MKRITPIFLALAALVIWQSCQDNEGFTPSPIELDLPSLEYDYSSQDFPEHFQNVIFKDNTPSTNQITDAGATLGRVLFYDTQMSKNNSVACASCHHQQLAFADNGSLSTGFEGIRTSRNSMAISNLRFHGNFFWDSNDITLEEQVLEPLKNHIEMGMENMDFLESKLNRVAYYPDLFEKAFGDSEVTSERVSLALAQFMRSMVSYDSKFDQGVASNFSNFNEIERLGMDLFNDHSRTACADCHSAESNFSATWRRNANIGLDMVYDDNGAGEGHFKIPSLRNVAMTAPYMHDGRYNTLEEVIDHYSDNIQNHPSLDWSLRDFETNQAKRMDLSPIEKKAMIAFLETLTDESYITDPKFSSPFK